LFGSVLLFSDLYDVVQNEPARKRSGPRVPLIEILAGVTVFAKTKQGEPKTITKKSRKVSARQWQRKTVMPVNQELTNVIKGRVIRRFEENAGELVIGFNDGSAMNIRDMETNSPPLVVGAQIKEIEEDGTEFTIQCEDGTTLSLQLTDPGSGISVRDDNEQVEYLG
jgi:hypothetical protein